MRRERDVKAYYESKKRLDYFGSRPEEIDQRLNALAKEVSLERTVQLTAAAGLILMAISLLQEGLRRRGLAGQILRRAGLRSQVEIDEERYALKALRGDFHRVPVGPGGEKGLPASILLDIARA